MTLADFIQGGDAALDDLAKEGLGMKAQWEEPTDGPPEHCWGVVTLREGE